MMHFGIPAYRLPRADLMKEIRRIEQMGVRIIVDRKVEDLLVAKAAGGFDAAFIAIGAHVARHAEIPARDAARMLDAVSLLRGVGNGQRPRLGRRVVVYGGGNTAMDAARTAKRLGADEALIIYRRDRAHMPAHAFEVDEALEEGVKIKWLTSIKEVVGQSLTVELVELDRNGRPQPTGQFETLEADAVVLALGQQTESGFLAHVPGIEFRADGTVIVGPDMMTGHAGIFAGGDMVPSERTVTVAVGHGKHAARHIDAWLRGAVYERPPKHPPVSFDMLDLPIFLEAARRREPALPLTARTSFAEIVQGLSEREARFEAGRCLSCGNCFDCDNCFAACPEQAILRLGGGHGYQLEPDLCTGCGICFEQCPCHAIEMVPDAMPTTAPIGSLGEPLAPHRFRLRE
jgi:NADPH-dependent glutamate synthase beta subunit-like oxidoreductase